jgi:hypothetical protein
MRMTNDPLVPRHRDYDMIQITPMRPNLTYQNHFDGALGCIEWPFCFGVCPNLREAEQLREMTE